MRPILIVQHEVGVSAGHFASWLTARSLPHHLLEVHRGAPMPASAEPFSGLCSLGGNMSANDPLPWIDEELSLMRECAERGVPIIGHCLGGQLLAKALGGDVHRNSCKEMGWLPVDVVDPLLVHEWMGRTSTGELFHWHGDAFGLPPGALRLLSSPLTPNQAYVVERGGVEHFGMQFHIEMTAELVTAWATDGSARDEVEEEIARTGGPGVQWPEDMCREAERRCEAMRPLAWSVYDRWSRGLRR